MDGDYVQQEYPKVESDETEGINACGYIIRFDDDINWHWLSKSQAAQLQRELNENGPGARKSLLRISIG